MMLCSSLEMWQETEDHICMCQDKNKEKLLLLLLLLRLLLIESKIVAYYRTQPHEHDIH